MDGGVDGANTGAGTPVTAIAQTHSSCRYTGRVKTHLVGLRRPGRRVSPASQCVHSSLLLLCKEVATCTLAKTPLPRGKGNGLLTFAIMFSPRNLPVEDLSVALILYGSWDCMLCATTVTPLCSQAPNTAFDAAALRALLVQG